MTKKIFTICLSIIAVSACVKDSEQVLSQAEKSSVVLHASNISTKTHLEDQDFGEIWWNAGDSLSLFTSQANDGGNKFITEEDGYTADFVGEVGTASKYFGLYPYSSSNGFNGNNAFSAVIPSVQVPWINGFDPAAMLSVGVSTSLEMGFYNVCGGLRFTVTKSDITSIVIKSNGGEKIAGNVSISLADPQNPKATAANGAVSQITLYEPNCFQTGAFYYVPMIPQVLSEGFTMQFYKGESLASTEVCSSYVVIKRGVFGSVTGVDYPGRLAAIFDGLDVSLNGTANCYVISSKGCYKFPFVKGNNPQLKPSGSPETAEIVWETDNTSNVVATNAILKRVEFKKGYVYIQTASPLKNGNALVAVKDNEGKILWSWHIWVCSGYDPDASKQLYSGAKNYYMDRNLGALSAAAGQYLSNGLLYQWGRKDPFMGAASISSNTMMASTHPKTTVQVSAATGTDTYATENPNVFICSSSSPKSWTATVNNSLWAANKTIFDPCPPGWKIPSDDKGGDWDSATYRTDTSSKGAYVTLSSGNGWFPAGGFLNCDAGELKNVGGVSFYWSYTLSGSYNTVALQVAIDGSNSGVYPRSGGKVRAEGQAVRCVKE